MNEKDISARQAALNTALRDTILKKIDSLRENIVFGKGSDDSSYFQMLIMIDEELDDVLLNWEYESISSRPPSQVDLDDEDDDY
jgi:hypothetical protein